MQVRAAKILKQVFGYDSFRPLQWDIINNVLHKRDTLVVMPTGGGKSLCYQIPALLFEGLTVVVSPLISLMKDQVEQLDELGVGAVYLNSTLSAGEYRENRARIVRGEIKLLYLAPETLLMERTLALLDSQTISCLAIDEAHCISEWGHDFRPEYRQLAELRRRYPGAVCMALTATATPGVQRDIKKSLSFDSSNEFVAGFDRPNLFLEICSKSSPKEQALAFVKRFHGQSGIIFCATRKKVDELTALLTGKGFSAAAYHAALSDQERQKNQELFIRDDVDIIVATIAFGMGINKPDIRFILHYDLPRNIESYYQQIGRAGRDGLRAHCLLLFGYGDIHTIKYFIDQKSESEKKIAMVQLNGMVGLAETELCRRMPLLTYFGDTCTGGDGETGCGMCDNCTGPAVEKSDITIAARKFLSCVKRTGELYGAGHIIDVLRGSKARKVLERGHDKLSTYGIGMEYTKPQWFQLSRQFIQKQLLHQDPEHGSLKLTGEAWEVLRGSRNVSGKVEAKGASGKMVEKKSRRISELEYDSDLFELLREKRKELADTAGVPPYVIFHDNSLLEMAISYPASPEAFLAIQGVGAVKLERYGEVFMEIIRRHAPE